MWKCELCSACLGPACLVLILLKAGSFDVCWVFSKCASCLQDFGQPEPGQQWAAAGHLHCPAACAAQWSAEGAVCGCQSSGTAGGPTHNRIAGCRACLEVILHMVSHICCLHCLDKLPTAAALPTVQTGFWHIMTIAYLMRSFIGEASMSQNHCMPCD